MVTGTMNCPGAQKNMGRARTFVTNKQTKAADRGPSPVLAPSWFHFFITVSTINPGTVLGVVLRENTTSNKGILRAGIQSLEKRRVYTQQHATAGLPL